MKKLIHYLTRPFPVYKDKRWKFILIASLLVFLVLALFQPFNIDKISRYKGLILVGYAGITALGMALGVYILPALFPNFYQKWTVWKNILNLLYIITFITIGNALFDYFLNSTAYSFPHLLLTFLKITFPVAFVPVVIITIYQQNKWLIECLREEQAMNTALLKQIKATSPHTLPTGTPITLTGATKESVELYPEEILYLEACGNYVKTHYNDKGESKQKMLRTTIKQLEEKLSEYPYIQRCHRAFLVNIKKITHVKGNSQGYQLSLAGTAEEVPVSRAYVKPLREKIEEVTCYVK